MRVPTLASRVLLAVLSAPGLVGGFTAGPKPAGGVAVCFAPDTPPDVVARIYANLAGRAAGPPPMFQFQDGDRWGGTATNSCCLQQGEPTTLTWSVVPDGTQIVATGQIPTEPSAPSDLRAFLDGIYGNEAVWRPLLQQVFDDWGQITGVTYVYEPSDAAADIAPSGPAPGQLGTRGDVRIGGHFLTATRDPSSYKLLPRARDMVIDTGDNFFFNTTANSLRLRNVVAHEQGHGLGIDHVCPVNQTKLMEPFVSTSYDGPSTTTSRRGPRLRRRSGDNDTSARPRTSDPGERHHDGERRERRRQLRHGLPQVHDRRPEAAHGDDDTVGFTYLKGPQNFNGSCPAGTSFNSLAENDLGVSVLASNGSTVLAIQNSNPAGGSEPSRASTWAPRATTSSGSSPDRPTRRSSTRSPSRFRTRPRRPVHRQERWTDDGRARQPDRLHDHGLERGALAATAPRSPTTSRRRSSGRLDCSATAGSSCPAGAPEHQRTVNLAVGGTLTFTLQATVAPGRRGPGQHRVREQSPRASRTRTPRTTTATDSDTLTPQANSG